MFLKCKEVKCIWRELNLETVRCDLMSPDLARTMMEKVLKLQPKTQMMVVLLLWIWWDERNKWREEGRRKTAREVAYLTAALSDRFQQQTNKALLSETRQVQGWSRLNPCVFKINSDGAFDSKSSHGRWGFIIRDDQGPRGDGESRSGEKKFLQNAFHAELLALFSRSENGCYNGFASGGSGN